MDFRLLGEVRRGAEASELLPRHWEWLEQHPSGASAAIRRLVEEAMHRKAGVFWVRPQRMGKSTQKGAKAG